MNKLLQNTYVRYGLALMIGAAIGAIFYPTKSIEREIESKYQSKIERLESDRRYIEEKYSQELRREINSNVEYRKETNKKISSLKTENTHLKQNVKEKTLKIVKPDGTIVEETFKESETEVVSKVVTSIKQEFNEKVSSIEKKWETVHKKRVRAIIDKHDKEIKQKEEIISSYKKKETIKINHRSFAIAAGKLNDDNYYGNVSYDIFGPVFINGHFEANNKFEVDKLGVGIGLRF